MKLSGASSEFFYCYSHGDTTFDLRIDFRFKDNINEEYIKRAAGEGLRLFPEFDIKPVIKDNGVYSVHNGGELVFADDADGIRYYGTEDTNGFLMYFACSGKNLSVFYYHGMSDVLGFISYLKSMFTLYLGYIGEKVTDEEYLADVRMPDAPKQIADEKERYDPYRLYGNKDTVPEYTFDNPGAFAIPTNDYPLSVNHVHSYLVDVSTSEFLSLTKKLGVSFVPLIVDIAANTVFNNYDTGDDPFIAMVPVNMRPFFGTSTAVNFSDGIAVPVYRSDMKLDIAERCAKTKEMMKKQITRANFENLMGGKSEIVDNFYADKTDVLTKKLNITGGKPAFTLPVTYPGKLSVGPYGDKLLDDITISAEVFVNSFVIHTYGDKMEFSVIWRSDDDTFAKALCEELKKYGFSPVLKDRGHIARNILMLDRLERIGG